MKEKWGGDISFGKLSYDSDSDDDTPAPSSATSKQDKASKATPSLKKPEPADLHNCYIIRATPTSTTTPSLIDIPSQITPLHLRSYGSEISEQRESKTRLGWKTVTEVGKFYDSLGSDSWYYYIYGSRDASKPINDVASLVCYGQIRGDVAVIRSGPAGGETPEVFTKEDLCRDVEFYKERSREKVFA